jgi:ribokinase
MTRRPSIVVVGSVNLDIVASVENLPLAGETVTGASLNRFPGGKGANQALAAKRLGADVSLVARVGNDAHAEDALALLLAGGVDLSACDRDESAPTGVALITVSSSGENQIVVAPGANRELRADTVALPDVDAMICQLEVPVETLDHVSMSFDGFTCINLAPALDVPDTLISRADLVVVNETEAQFYGGKLQGCTGLQATTFGAQGAVLTKAGSEVARSKSPVVDAMDTTAAGDTFTAALTLAILERMELQEALDFACAAGAAAAMKPGAQPSLPCRAEVNALLSERSRE